MTGGGVASVKDPKVLPLWHHLGEDPDLTQLNNTSRCVCLRRKHGAHEIGDAMKIMARLDDQDHESSKDCMCIECFEDRAFKQCNNPHSCAVTARTRLDRILAHYDPRRATNDQGAPQNIEEHDEEDTKIFRRPDRVRSLTDGFRVFTNNKKFAPVEQNQPPARHPMQASPLTVCYAGATSRTNSVDAQAGAGIWVEEGHGMNAALKVPPDMEQSKQSAEILAALHIVQSTDDNTELRLECQGKSTMHAMTRDLEKRENTGWIGTPNSAPLRTLAAALKKRKAKTLFSSKGRAEGIENATSLARTALVKEGTDPFYLHISPGERLAGAKLSSMTRSISYKGIKELNDPVSRKATEENVKKIQEALKENFGNSPKPSAIWASIRQKDISRNVRNFLWKSMHSAHRLGKYWTHIPECEERANCAHCGQSQIWALAEELWRKKHTEWPTLSMGAALGCGMAIFKDDNGMMRQRNKKRRCCPKCKRGP
ncbi:hypothetical protein B0H19DRAFT_370253 [Mycena capillaripes]|nr:hypothetical protein B0H19DRAFT_370253 [Mycena capillaripes]